MQKAVKKYGEECKTPAESLEPADKKGWLTKQGGSVKTWKKRWCVLKGKTLYYYKGQKDLFYVGKVDFEPQSLVKEEQAKKKSNLFSISTSKRVFYMFPDTPAAMKEWVEAMSRAIDFSKGGGAAAPAALNAAPAGAGAPVGAALGADQVAQQPQAAPVQAVQPVAQAAPSTAPATGGVATADMTPRQKLALAKGNIPFLRNEDSKVLEFWQIWSDSIPTKGELTKGNPCEFLLACSIDMQKLTWRVSGPQNAFIQKMVDFFWNVGAPESEIDRLNDVGAEVNPLRIGSWIDMSEKNGMDGGWYFPVEITLAKMLSSADDGVATLKFKDWCDSHGVAVGLSVGRDMGAAPPRQTELRVLVPGATYADQVTACLSAWADFDFPPMSPQVLDILQRPGQAGIILSVITSSEGFVRLGIMCPKPTTEVCVALMEANPSKPDAIATLEASLGVTGPEYVEYQHLMTGFGYGVYTEGYDTIFHFNAGSEEGE